jgi:DNA-binding HxlR family transcriptional regulator
MAKKFSDDELDEVLSKIEKFDTDGIRFIYLKNSVKKNFVKIKIAEFKLKDILVFLDENGLVQRIPFDDKPGFHDLTLYRISEKGRDLIDKFAREPNDDWNKSSYPSNVSCQNCGNSYEMRVAYSETVKTWAKSQRCPNCAVKGMFVTKFI